MKFKKTILWIFAVLLFILALSLLAMKSPGFLLLTAASFWCIPKFNEKIKLKKVVKILTPFILFIVAVILTPTDDSARTNNESTAATSSAVVESQLKKSDSETNIDTSTKNTDNPVKAETSTTDQAYVNQSLGTLEVHFIDVGQGDATLIKDGTHAMLIDAGNNDKGSTVKYYLEKQGITKLDFVILTHPDADHIGGADVAIYNFECGKIIMPNITNDTDTYRDVIDTINSKNYKITNPTVGTAYTLGSSTFTIISPFGDYGDDKNENSVGIILTHGDNKFMFIGDAENDSESDILKENIDLDVDVYKAAHHGSENGTTTDFLSAISPEYSVISVGAGNTYGHPDKSVLDLLNKNSVQIFRTDEQGNIVVTSNGTTLKWNTTPSTTLQPGAKDTEPEISTAKKAEQQITINTSEGTYILNTDSMKYHLPSCSSVKDLSSGNYKNSSSTREQLISEGYVPCKRCDP